MDYSLPEAVLKFRQGAGRLIRSKTDEGIITILDFRILSKQYGKYFLNSGGPTEDDHMPFLAAGVNAVDLIDFDKDYWHTDRDTMDKLAAHSFEVVGTVLLRVIDKLETQR